MLLSAYLAFSAVLRLLAGGRRSEFAKGRGTGRSPSSTRGVGVVVADFVRARADHHSERMALGGPLGQIAYLVVLAVFVLTAAAQLRVPTGILTMLAGLLIGAAALSVALAFGLGGREVARELSAARYVASAFQIGQAITVEQISGEIVSLEQTAVLVQTDDGHTVRVPNHLLVARIVGVTERPRSSSTG